MLNPVDIGPAMDRQTQIRDLATKFLVPTPDSEESKDPLRMANAYAAVETVVSLINIFKTIHGTGNALLSVTDLVFGLNNNPFWLRNTSYLMPLLNAAINAIHDLNEVGTPTEPIWKNLDYHNRHMWLELLPAIMFLVHGPTSMRAASLEMKKSFEGFV